MFEYEPYSALTYRKIHTLLYEECRAMKFIESFTYQAFFIFAVVAYNNTEFVSGCYNLQSFYIISLILIEMTIAMNLTILCMFRIHKNYEDYDKLQRIEDCIYIPYTILIICTVIVSVWDFILLILILFDECKNYYINNYFELWIIYLIISFYLICSHAIVAIGNIINERCERKQYYGHR